MKDESVEMIPDKKDKLGNKIEMKNIQLICSNGFLYP